MLGEDLGRTSVSVDHNQKSLKNCNDYFKNTIVS